MSPTQPTTAPPPAAANPFYLGWRPRYVTHPDGRVEEERIPLTLQDLLHPQSGDVEVESRRHRTDAFYLYGTFLTRAVGEPHVVVVSDCLIEWGVAGVGNHSPDVAVLVGLRHNPPPDLGSMPLGELGGRCALAIEVVSPDSRSNDVVEKLRHYHQVRVETYVIIDQISKGGPRSISAYRRNRHGWTDVALGPDGRLHLPVYGVLIGIRDEDNRVVCYDAQTGEELLDHEGAIRRAEEFDRRNTELEESLTETILQSQEDRRKRAEAEQLAARERQERVAIEAAAAADRQRIAQQETLIASLQAGQPPAAP